HAVGHSLNRNIEPTFASELRHQATIGGMNARHYRRLVFCEHLVIWQILRETSDVQGDATCHEEHQHRSDPEEISDKPYHKCGILPSDYSHDKCRSTNSQPFELVMPYSNHWLSDQQMSQRQDGLRVFTNLTLSLSSA